MKTVSPDACRIARATSLVALMVLVSAWAADAQAERKETTVTYDNALEPTPDPPPMLADFPEFVEPVRPERRLLAKPLVNEPGGKLLVRAWRYWYNARGIVEMENRLEAGATAVVVVHPWGLDDGHGLKTPEPAGVAFFCTREKNELSIRHTRAVISPFLARLRGKAALVGYSMPGTEDAARKRMYASVLTKPESLDVAEGERRLARQLGEHDFTAQPLVKALELDPDHPVKSYLDQTPSTDAGDRYNGPGYWSLPMPVSRGIDHKPDDVVFYDAEGYPKVRDYLKGRGVRHVLLLGYATDMCVISTTCGYQNLSQDFNLFLVGDGTLATFPGSDTPRFATQVALANAALRQMITQVNWVRFE